MLCCAAGSWTSPHNHRFVGMGPHEFYYKPQEVLLWRGTKGIYVSIVRRIDLVEELGLFLLKRKQELAPKVAITGCLTTRKEGDGLAKKAERQRGTHRLQRTDRLAREVAGGVRKKLAETTVHDLGVQAIDQEGDLSRRTQPLDVRLARTMLEDRMKQSWP